jgi:hypothetical protein
MLNSIDDNALAICNPKPKDLKIIPLSNDIFRRSRNVFNKQIFGFSKLLVNKICDDNGFLNKIPDLLKGNSYLIQGTFLIDDLVYFCNYNLKNWVFSGDLIVARSNGDVFFAFSNYELQTSSYFDDQSERYGRDVLENLKICGNHLVKMFIFQKYAKVETKVISPNEKYKIEKGNIFNETRLPITYVDSTWFTNLVVSGAFAVRGHFRLQPKKDEKGKWTKELIWIKDFEKQGYHRQAKILNERK